MRGRITTRLGRSLAAALAVAALAVFAAPASALAVEVASGQDLQSAVAEGGEVAVTGTVTLTEPLVIEKNVTLTGGTIALDASFAKGESLAPITVGKDARLTLVGVTLDGGSVDLGYSKDDTGSMLYVQGALEMTGGSVANVTASGSGIFNRGVIYLADGSEFTMSGGTITNCEFTAGSYQGIVCVAAGSTFNLKGTGAISNCEVYDPQGASGIVTVKDAKSDKPGTFNMSGGEISDNKSCGVLVGSNDMRDVPAVFNLSGGKISENVYGTNASYAGGVYVTNGKVEMSGGTISDNEGHYYGGGIFVTSTSIITDWTSEVLLEGGRIENNTADRQGGGIYVVKGQEVNLQNAVITGNHAKKLGSGVWTCSTGDMRVYVTNGGAVFGNEASGDERGSAGADLAFVKHEDDQGAQDFSVAVRARRRQGQLLRGRWRHNRAARLGTL